MPTTGRTPFIGASAPWVEDEEDVESYGHVLRHVAEYLRARLQVRLHALDLEGVGTDAVVLELRRQMAECAVDGNLMVASEIGEATWSLLEHKDGTKDTQKTEEP